MNLFISDWEAAPSGAATDETVFAIGDVHGHLDHLKALIGWIAAETGPGTAPHLVMLGDYVDRGEASIATLSYLDEVAQSRIRITLLRGNHEEYLEWFLDDSRCNMDHIDFWAGNGGRATLANLGLAYEDFIRTDMETLQVQARAALPDAARATLARLQPLHRHGSYFFVHAGVHPTEPVDPDSETLTEIRQPFLKGENWSHDFVVVHGHSICGPDVKPHRVALDSGAYRTGVMTAVQLQDDRLRFIAATPADDLSGLALITRRGPRNETWTRV
ncbi:Bis(5'-nucleosyl)-tetraphosphatase, symmetrical [Alphaproteobacteria bacterium SO-S41]|nr:Bis(5'-nucleosyl)-tetraphosphatase, symmetrical [Alphaproteobacteria bacterium SO-S41]